MTRPLDKLIDDILEVLYDASDVPHMHRKYPGRMIDDDLESLIDRVVDDFMDQRKDPTEDIRDLEDRIKKIEDAIGMLTRAVKDV